MDCSDSPYMPLVISRLDLESKTLLENLYSELVPLLKHKNTFTIIIKTY